MGLYQDVDLPVREALIDVHEKTLSSFARPGQCWTGAQRAALVAEARHARCNAGLQPQEQHTPLVERTMIDLPDAARKVARHVAVAVNDLTQGFVADALAAGLSEEEYVETIGVVSRLTSVDIFARGIGAQIPPIPTVQEGPPSCARPSHACDEGAWLPTVPGGRRGGADALAIYASETPQAAPFIYRALSLVPQEARGLIALGDVQYLPLASFMDLDFSFEPSITRPQYELVAARVSAFNECFY